MMKLSLEKLKMPIKEEVKKDKDAITKEKIKSKKRMPSKEEIQFKNRFYELMFELDLYNKFKKTYKLNILKETNYGYYAHLYLAAGLSFNKLEVNRHIIEQNLKCMWIMIIEPFKEYAEIQIVLNPVDKTVDFRSPNIKPNELYLGLSFSNQIQKINVNEHHMFLLAGAIGSGKTRFMYQILLSWILSCTPEEVNIYLSDIAKNEYIQFKDIKHVKYYASETEELYNMIVEIRKEFNRRNKLLTKLRENSVATNIEEYNKLNKNNILPYLYIVIDEFSVLLPDKTDSKEETNQKEYIIDNLKKFAKLGRSLGVFTFMATQKTTRDEIPSIIKNNSGVRISFRANDQISSGVILGEGDNSAMGLPKRVAVYKLDGSLLNYLYSPNLATEQGKLKKMLDPYIDRKTIQDINIKKNKPNVLEEKSVSKWTRIPKGVDGIEYIKSLKNKKASIQEEDDYIDYGSR